MCNVARQARRKIRTMRIRRLHRLTWPLLAMGITAEQTMTAAMASPPKKKKQITSLIIIRHAERIDDHRIPGGFASNCSSSAATNNLDWRLDTEPGRQRPWDPPLSLGGIEQSEAFGRLLPHLIEEFKLPPLGAVYASPVVRCVETGLAAMQAHDAELMAMKERREKEKESRRQANAGEAPPVPPIQTKGCSSLGSKFRFGGKGKKKANNTKTAAINGHDMATAVGMAHIRAPSIADIADMTADLYSATMDMLGLEDGTAEETTTEDNVESNSTDNGLETIQEKSSSSQTQQQKDRQIQRFEAKGPVQLRYELGLMECIHKQWYEQWCTIVDAPMEQSTVVGEHRMTIDDNDSTTSRDEKNSQEQQQSLHPMARVAVNHCFPEPRDAVSLLGGVIRMFRCEKNDMARNGRGNGSRQMLQPDAKCDQRKLSNELLGRVDTDDHVEPFSTFIKDYQYEVMYETGKAGLNRQDAAIRAIAARHVGETVVCVTHYVPCAHLFGRLTGRDGVVEHGKAGYTAFSVYVHSDGREGGKHTDWRPLIINDQRHLQTHATIRTEVTRPAKKKYNLRSRLYGF